MRQELAERDGRARELARLAVAELQRLDALWRRAERRNTVLAAQLEALRAMLARRGAELDAARASERKLAEELARLREERMRLLRDGVKRLLEVEIDEDIAPVPEAGRAGEGGWNADPNAALGRLGFRKQAGGWMRTVPSDRPEGLAGALERLRTLTLPLRLGALLGRHASLELVIRVPPPEEGGQSVLAPRAEEWRSVVEAYGVPSQRVRIVPAQAREGASGNAPGRVLWLEVRGGGR